MTADARRARIARYLPALMLIIDPVAAAASPHHRSDAHRPERGEGSPLITVIRDAVAGGVNMLQVRDKRPDATPLRLADEALDAIDGEQSRAMLWINDNYAVAMTVESGALHLPAGRPMPPARQRRMLCISRAVHGVDAAVQAEAEGADMLVLGTVFPSQSHPGGRTVGLEGVRAVCERVNVPVIAIGGITAANAGDVIRAGGAGVAVISAIFGAPDPRAAAAAIRSAIDAAWSERTGPTPAQPPSSNPSTSSAPSAVSP